MKVSVLSENLQKKLSLLSHAISQKAQLPILQNFLFEAEQNKIRLSATDLEIGIIIEIDALVEEQGRVTIPAKTFFEFIQSLSAENISIYLEQTTLHVDGKNVKATFQTIASEDFPTLFEDQGETLLNIKGKELEDLIASVVFAAGVDASRPDLTGVLVKFDGSELTFVATDGYRLSIKKYPFESVDKEEKQILIPARILREFLQARLQTEEVTLAVSKTNNQVFIKLPGTTFIGRLIEGVFPNYQRIIPTSYETQVFFDREQMQKAVKLSSIFARESANIVKMSIKEDSVVISANSPSVGEDAATVEAVVKGEENEIAFNARYLMDLFGNISASEFVFETSGPLNPGAFKIKGDNSFLHIIMPIRVQKEE